MSKAVTKAAGCGLSGDVISALHQHHSNMSQAVFGLMLTGFFALILYIIFF